MILGVGAGLTGGLFGVGGGIIVVPGLVLLLGLTPHRAHPTSGAAIVATAAAALSRFALADSVDWTSGPVLFAGAGLGAWVGTRVIDRVSAPWLTRAFVAVLALSAVRMAFGGGAGGMATSVDLRWWTVGGLLVAGCAAGLAAAVLGVGGGLIFVPTLVGLFSVAQHVAQGTSLAVMLPTTLVATFLHGRAGRIDWRLAAAVGAGGVLGGWLGAELALAIGGLALRRMFAGLLILVALRMLRSAQRLDRAVRNS